MEAASLNRGPSVDLPAQVHYAWPHPERRVLYVASSDGGPDRRGGTHHLSAFTVEGDGALELVNRVPLPSRPIHCCVDPASGYVFTAHNLPSTLSVHRLDGNAIGVAVPQDPALDCGIYAHQVRVTESGDVLLVARGNDAAEGRAEDPGSLHVFGCVDGRLELRQKVTPGDSGGYGFGPRHLDLHPDGWVVVSVERQSELHVYRFQDRRLSDDALYTASSVAVEDPDAQQMAGTLRIHPEGRFVYQANRTEGRNTLAGWPVGRTGEDSLVTWRLDQATGAPVLIQREYVPGRHIRTVSLEPSGRLLAAASIQPVPVTASEGVVLRPAAILLYRVQSDGHVTFARRYDIDTAGRLMFWTGFVAFD